MTYVAIVDGEYSADIATTKGWSAVMQWVDQQAPRGSLAALIDQGETDNVPACFAELDAAMRSSAPEGDVATTLAGLRDVLAEGGKVLLISDGTTD